MHFVDELIAQSTSLMDLPFMRILFMVFSAWNHTLLDWPGKINLTTKDQFVGNICNDICLL